MADEIPISELEGVWKGSSTDGTGKDVEVRDTIHVVSEGDADSVTYEGQFKDWKFETFTNGRLVMHRFVTDEGDLKNAHIWDGNKELPDWVKQEVVKEDLIWELRLKIEERPGFVYGRHRCQYILDGKLDRGKIVVTGPKDAQGNVQEGPDTKVEVVKGKEADKYAIPIKRTKVTYEMPSLGRWLTAAWAPGYDPPSEIAPFAEHLINELTTVGTESDTFTYLGELGAWIFTGASAGAGAVGIGATSFAGRLAQGFAQTIITDKLRGKLGASTVAQVLAQTLMERLLGAAPAPIRAILAKVAGKGAEAAELKAEELAKLAEYMKTQCRFGIRSLPPSSLGSRVFEGIYAVVDKYKGTATVVAFAPAHKTKDGKDCPHVIMAAEIQNLPEEGKKPTPTKAVYTVRSAGS